MTNLYSAAMAIIFIALLVSAYRFIRRRTDFNRMTVWGCITALVIMLAVGKPVEFTSEQESAFIASLRDTSTELKKYSEVDEVYFSSLNPTAKLEITLQVNESATEDFLSAADSETRRIFLHALVDNWRNPHELTGGGTVCYLAT